MSGNGWPKQVSHKHHNKHTTHPTVTKSSMQSHKRATPQPSPTHQPHTHTKWRQARRQGWHKASVPQQSEAPTTMVFCHHTHRQCNHQASQSKRHLVLVFVARLMPLTHTPQGRGEPWLMTRGVHHGSSHSHTQVANTPATVQHALVHAMVSINHATHTHTKGRGPWIDGQSGIHNMPPLRERERLDGGQWTCERGQATCNTTGQKEAPLKPCSHHSSLHQQPPHHHTHHTSVVMVTHCLLTHTHTRAKAGQGAHHHQANGVDGLHSDHGVAQAWLWCGVAIKPCATRGGTHAIQVATCSPHCPTTTTTPVLSGVNTRATTSPHPSPRVCV